MPKHTAAAEAEIAAIVTFLSTVSIELTRPGPKDFDDLRGFLAEGAEVFLTAVPGRSPDELVTAAEAARARGFEPIPHVAARHYESIDALERAMEALARRAAPRAIMLIGGDRPPGPGRVPDAMAALTSGVFSGKGIQSVGLPGFPDGHPVLSDEELELALVTKIAAAQRAGLEPFIVTQFGFDAAPVEIWLEWLRRRGVRSPVRIGFAGPTSLMSWLKYARTCGVRASAEALASRSGLARHAFRSVSPDESIRRIARKAQDGRFGEVAAHIFAFAGAASTARWIASTKHGRIALTPEGFETLEED